MDSETARQSDALTREQLAELERKLDASRTEVQERLTRRRRSLRTRTADDPGDEMDLALASTNLELTARLIERDSKLLAEIENARAKMHTGRYGYCEKSGEAIGFERLMVRPWTRFAGSTKEVVDRDKRAARAGGQGMRPGGPAV